VKAIEGYKNFFKYLADVVNGRVPSEHEREYKEYLYVFRRILPADLISYIYQVIPEMNTVLGVTR
jgi:predicted nucleotidyltransferase